VGVNKNNENHETLHIKKHGSGGEEVHYYSSRKERLSMPSASKLYIKTPKKRRRRTSSIIIILDIVIIVIAFILFRLFLFEPANQETLSGYRFTLRQIITTDSVIASITVENTRQTAQSRELQSPETQAQVVFLAQPKNTVRTAAIELPETLNGIRIIRVHFPLLREQKTIRAEITLGKESAVLTLPIKK